jgi:hypothetical protein
MSVIFYRAMEALLLLACWLVRGKTQKIVLIIFQEQMQQAAFLGESF